MYTSMRVRARKNLMVQAVTLDETQLWRNADDFEPQRAPGQGCGKHRHQETTCSIADASPGFSPSECRHSVRLDHLPPASRQDLVRC